MGTFACREAIVSADRPFSRHYYVDLARDYPSMYRDDHLHAVFSRLLDVADAMWPALPEIPRSEKLVYVRRLVALGLVIREGEFCFRIKGMEADRTTRQEAARTAANARWSAARNAASNADRTTDAMPIQPSRAIPAARAHSASKKNGHVVDERDLSDLEKQRRYDKRQTQLTGVKA